MRSSWLRGVTVGVFVMVTATFSLGCSTTATSQNSSRDTAAPTTSVPPTIPDGFRPGMAPDGTTPPRVEASGACEQALDAMRQLMASNPTGATVDPLVTASITENLTRISDACAQAVVLEFQAVELDPWLHYRVK